MIEVTSIKNPMFAKMIQGAYNNVDFRLVITFMPHMTTGVVALDTNPYLIRDDQVRTILKEFAPLAFKYGVTHLSLVAKSEALIKDLPIKEVM